jgi:hypothetical protein
MGQEKGTTVVNQTSTATPTAEETALNKLQLEQAQAFQPYALETQKQSGELISKLLSGSTDLPGFFGELGKGISPDVTSSIVQQSLQDLYPQFQSSGVLDSGTAASVSARTAADIRNAAEEFNIGNKFNLLNLAFGGQAQVQQPVLATAQSLGDRLSGLRTVNSSSNSTTKTMNPFLKSFQTSLGTSLGSGSFGK